MVIAGHSEGSLVGMLTAEQINPAGYISLAGAGRNIADVLKEQFKTAIPDSLQHMASQMLDSLRAGHLVKKVNPLLIAIFRPQMQPYLISWMRYEPTNEIKKLRCNTVIVSGKTDFQVSVAEAERLKAAHPAAQLLLIDNMNHVLKNAPADRVENLKTYTNPALPLKPGLASTIAAFVLN